MGATQANLIIHRGRVIEPQALLVMVARQPEDLTILPLLRPLVIVSRLIRHQLQSVSLLGAPAYGETAYA